MPVDPKRGAELPHVLRLYYVCAAEQGRDLKCLVLKQVISYWIRDSSIQLLEIVLFDPR